MFSVQNSLPHNLKGKLLQNFPEKGTEEADFDCDCLAEYVTGHYL
jgi:hypothetical protein